MPLAPFINPSTDPILMYDPLPPPDSIDIYERLKMRTPSRQLPDASPFSMFFQSLLPNFNVQEGGLSGEAAALMADAMVDEAAGGADPPAPANAINWNEMHNQIDEELRLMDNMDGKCQNYINNRQVLMI